MDTGVFSDLIDIQCMYIRIGVMRFAMKISKGDLVEFLLEAHLVVGAYLPRKGT